MTNHQVVAALKPAALDDLPEGDMDTRIAAIIASPRPARARRTRRTSGRPLLLVATGAVVAAAAIAVVSTRDSDHPADPVVPVVPAPPNVPAAAALSFTEKGGYLIVKVKDPVADPARYKREFAARGLNVELTLAPTSKRKAGTVIFMEDSGDIETIAAPGHCGTVTCNVGIKIPLKYKAYAHVVFGRTARPGEHYDTGPGDAPGEGVGLSNVKNRTVADVLAEAKKRHITDIEYRYENNETTNPYPNGIPADKVKSTWYVHEALAGNKGQTILFIGPTPTP